MRFERAEPVSRTAAIENIINLRRYLESQSDIDESAFHQLQSLENIVLHTSDIKQKTIKDFFVRSETRD